MDLIQKFTYSIWKTYSKSKEYMGETLIEKELERSVIEFFNKKLNKIDVSNFKFQNSISKKDRIYEGTLYQNSYYRNLNFNKKEILFLVKNYGLTYSNDLNISLLPPPLRSIIIQ